MRECPRNLWFSISTEERVKRNAPNLLHRELECAESDNGLRCLDDCIMPGRDILELYQVYRVRCKIVWGGAGVGRMF